MGRHRSGAERAESRLAILLVTPTIVLMAAVALIPIAATAWEALHRHDLRLPWLGTPFVGLANFTEAAGDPRFGGALVHTLLFAAVSVPLELALGLALALVMHTAVSGRGIVRTAALLPWAVPTVVVALVWRFMFEAQSGVFAASFDWFAGPVTAWVPIVIADVWKTTPFVAILVLAGLQTIDHELYEAARVDGASPARQFLTITLPLLAPALVVAGTFRLLDALRLFDLSYVLTGGGPGTATEPLSLYAFVALMQRLRFGYGSALSIAVFLMALGVALLCVRLLDRAAPRGAR
jgi:ABC-type sugar transport system permease subunit